MGPEVPRGHFHVTARELRLEEPERCPFLPALTMDGLAVTPEGQHHLILTLRATDRMYFGPDERTVTRRTQILTMALQRGEAALDRYHADLVGEWVATVWEAAIDELVDAMIGTDLAKL